MSETETRDGDDGAVLRSIAKSIRPAFPEAADLLLGIEAMHWPTEAHRQHEAASAARAELSRLTHLLGSHADGHRCTCTMTDPGVYHGDNMHPPEWEQDPWCPTHPDVDYISTEFARLRGVVEAVQALAVDAKVAISRGCLCSGDNCTGKCGAGKPLGWTLDPEQVLAALAPVSSSGEAESGEGLRVEIDARRDGPTACKVWRRDVLVFDGVSRDALIPEPLAPAPVPSGGQADGEGVRLRPDEIERLDFNYQVGDGRWLYAEIEGIIARRLAARPVLSREALAKVLTDHRYLCRSDRGVQPRWEQCACGERFSGEHPWELLAAHQAYHLADVLHPQDGGQR